MTWGHRALCDGLGLKVLYRFDIMLSFRWHSREEGVPYHFEFTKKRGHTAGCSTTDNLCSCLDHPKCRLAYRSPKNARRGFAPVLFFNPYRAAHKGVTFEDPTGPSLAEFLLAFLTHTAPCLTNLT